MAGTQAGGRKAAITNKTRYGLNFYVIAGRKGGKVSRGGGFGSDIVGPDGLTGKERASIVGKIGGHNGVRGKNKTVRNHITPEQQEVHVEDRPISLLRRMSRYVGIPQR